LFLITLSLAGNAESTELRQPKQELPGLETAQTLLIEAQMAATLDDGDQNLVLKIVGKRMEEMGYRVVGNAGSPHDVVIRVFCEAVLPKRGHSKASPPIHQMPFERMLNPEPPCSFQYLFEGEVVPWKRINHVVYTDGVQAAKRIVRSRSIPTEKAFIISFLEEYEFPLLLAAEWGHAGRLLQKFHAPGTPYVCQVKIISLFGEIEEPQGFPFLVQALREKDLVPDVARALGHFGEKARPYLVDLLKKSGRPEVQAAAANGLGRVGAMTGDTSSTLLLLEMLTRPATDIEVKTEIVWALGKAPDFAAYPVLAELEREVWLARSSDPQLQQLRQAVNWSIREVRQGGHTDDFE
jgi:hypothetical protein